MIQELARQERAKNVGDRKFDILYWDLEGIQSINGFCLTLFDRLLELDSVTKRLDQLQSVFGNLWNVIAKRIGKAKLPSFEIELRATTKEYTFEQWKEKIEPLLISLNSSERQSVLVFDEFPDMGQVQICV